MADDPERIERAKAGDPLAWRELYDAHAGAVRRALSGWGNLSAADVEDLVQETFVTMVRSLDQLRSPDALRPWVLTIARSLAIRKNARDKAEGKKRADLGDEIPEAPISIEDDRAREHRIATVRALIEALPPGAERDTVHLFYVEGKLSASEIAEKLGVGKSTITMRLERFRAKVKRRLMAEM